MGELTAEAHPELIEKVSQETCAYVFPEVAEDETD